VRSAPQIAKVVRARSAEGLSLVAVAVELLCYTVTIAYNASRGYPLNTYGEVAACWLQDVALVLLVLRYGAPRAVVARAPRRAALAAAAFVLLVGWLLSPACPRDLLAALQAANLAVLALGSRVPQIVLNVRRGDAGLLSATSCALNVAGNAARLFTTAVLTRDGLLMAGALTQGALNGVLLWQALATKRKLKLKQQAAATAGSGGVAVAVAATEAEAEASAAALPAGQEEEEEAEEQQQQQQVGAVFPASTGGPAAVYAAG
jgi:mannose-P-dolichol utilization defect protein 1